MHLVTCCTRVRDLCQCACVSSFSLYTRFIATVVLASGARATPRSYIARNMVSEVGSRGPSRKNDRIEKDRKGNDMAAGNYTLPPPAQLEIHSDRAGEKWKRFKRAWDSYALATGLNEKAEDVQVSTLLTVIGEEAREVYSTFTGWENAGDS